MRANADSSSQFERTIFPEGVFVMTMTKALLMWGKPTEYKPEGLPKIMMVWTWTDPDDADSTAELVDYLNFPTNFSFNEKSAFWKRMAEVLGAPITKENAPDLDLDLGEFVQTYDELVEYIQSKDENGKTNKLEVKAITMGTQQLLGKTCQLAVKVWNGTDGQPAGNNIGSVLQIGATAKPTKPKPAGAAPKAAPAAPAAAPRVVQEAKPDKLLTAPPRPVNPSTEPLQSEEIPY